MNVTLECRKKDEFSSIQNSTYEIRLVHIDYKPFTTAITTTLASHAQSVHFKSHVKERRLKRIVIFILKNTSKFMLTFMFFSDPF